MQARSAKGRYCGSVYSSRLYIFFSPPSRQPRTLPILKTLTHYIQRSIHLANRCPQRKTALKNSHRWCYTPPASVTSQTAPHRTAHPTSPHPTQPTPRGLSPSSGSLRQAFFQKGLLLLLLLLLLHHYRCVYRFIAALSVLSRHQHRTLLALNSGPL